MIIIRVELWSAVNGQRTELARMMIDNIGGTNQRGDYAARTYVGRSAAALDQAMLKDRIAHKGEVRGHARLRLHVWHLVAKALVNLGYGAAK